MFDAHLRRVVNFEVCRHLGHASHGSFRTQNRLLSSKEETIVVRSSTDALLAQVSRKLIITFEQILARRLIQVTGRVETFSLVEMLVRL